MQIVGVLLPLPFNETFDYKAEDDVSLGSLVRVSFGKENVIINTGILIDDEVKISKKPTPFLRPIP